MVNSAVRVIKEIGVEVPNLGKRIREARLCDRRSLKEICDTLGMSTMTWYRIEKEKQTVTLEQLRSIESVLNVDFGVYIEGWDE